MSMHVNVSVCVCAQVHLETQQIYGSTNACLSIKA